MVRYIEVKSRNRTEMIDITAEVRDIIKAWGVKNGLCQLFVLHTLGSHGKLSLGEVAQRTFTDPSSVSVVVRKLEARGLVVKGVAETDHRRLEIGLSPEGRQLLGPYSRFGFHHPGPAYFYASVPLYVLFPAGRPSEPIVP